jgi:hypothetical protein
MNLEHMYSSVKGTMLVDIHIQFAYCSKLTNCFLITNKSIAVTTELARMGIMVAFYIETNYLIYQMEFHSKKHMDIAPGVTSV